MGLLFCLNLLPMGPYAGVAHPKLQVPDPKLQVPDPKLQVPDLKLQVPVILLKFASYGSLCRGGPAPARPLKVAL